VKGADLNGTRFHDNNNDNNINISNSNSNSNSNKAAEAFQLRCFSLLSFLEFFFLLSLIFLFLLQPPYPGAVAPSFIGLK